MTSTEHQMHRMGETEPDTLREAAGLMRDDCPTDLFFLAVADWLDACALVVEVAPDRHRALALRVARAYLGTAP